MSETEKRIYVGGLFDGVKESEITERFSRFGQVKQVEIKVRPSDNGSPAKTFAYVSLQTSEDKLKKCFNTYSKTKWKGGVLKLQLAKDNFIERLQQERLQAENNKTAEVPPEPVVKTPKVENRLEGIPGVDNFQMKGAKPGTAIPGEKDWIVGKYGRVLPVVNVKKSGSNRIIKVDPSKLTHNLKRINDDHDVNGSANITWELDEQESEITKRRKGEFDEKVAKRQKKNHGNESLKKVFEVLDNDKKAAEERRNAAMELVVVPVNPVCETDLAKKLLDISAKTKFDSDSDDEGKRPARFGDKHKAEKKAAYLKRKEERMKQKEEEEMKNATAEKRNEDKKVIDKKVDKNDNITKAENDKGSKGKVDKMDKGIDVKGDKDGKGTEGEASKKMTRKERLKTRWKNIVDAKKERKKANRTAYLAARKNEKLETKPSDCKGIEDDDDGVDSDSSTNTIELLKQKKAAVTKVNPDGKKEAVKSWLNANSVVNEFSDGFNESVQRPRYQADESDDDEDDFKAFVQNEMKKVARGNINRSHQVAELNDDVDSMEIEVVEAKTTPKGTPHNYFNAKSSNKKFNAQDKSKVDENATNKLQLKKPKANEKPDLRKGPLANKVNHRAVELEAPDKFEEDDDGADSVSSADTMEILKSRIPSSKINKETNEMKSKPPDPKTKIKGSRVNENAVETLKSDEESSEEDSDDSDDEVSDEDDESEENDGSSSDKNVRSNKSSGTLKEKQVPKLKESGSKDIIILKNGLSKSAIDVKSKMVSKEIESESSDDSDDDDVDDDEENSDDDEVDDYLESDDDEEESESDDDDDCDNNDTDDESEDDFKALITNEMKKVTANDSTSPSLSIKPQVISEAKSNDTGDSESDSMETTETDIKKVNSGNVKNGKSMSKPLISKPETDSSDSDSSESGSNSDDDEDSDEVDKKVPENVVNKPKAKEVESESDSSSSESESAEEKHKNVPENIIKNPKSVVDKKSELESSSSDSDIESDLDSGNRDNKLDVETRTKNQIATKSNNMEEDSSSSDSSSSESDDSEDEIEEKTVASQIKIVEDKKKLTAIQSKPNDNKKKEVNTDSSSESSEAETSDSEDENTEKDRQTAFQSKPTDDKKVKVSPDSSSESSDLESSDSEDQNTKKTKPIAIQSMTIDNKKNLAAVDSSSESSDSESGGSEDDIQGQQKQIQNKPVDKEKKQGTSETSSESSSDESSESESSDSEMADSGKRVKSDMKQVRGTIDNTLTKKTKVVETVAKAEGVNKKGAEVSKVEVSKGAKESRDRSKGGAKPEDVDKKRLESLRQRQEETKQQKSAIQKALAGIDQKGSTPNKKIVFDDSDDDDNMGGGGDAGNYSSVMENENDALGSAKSKIPQREKTSKLFDSSSSDDSDDDGDDDARFQIKQQFEGSAGTKLANLQSRYSNDERFKLDARFAESGSEDDDSGVVQDTDLSEEKLRSMRILQSVVGAKGIKALSRQEKAKKQFKDIKTLQYDPSIEEHKQFEVKKDPTKPKAKKKKSKNLDSSDDDDDDNNNQAPPEEVIIPEVSKEKFVEVTDSLRDTFISKAKEPQQEQKGGTFSLLAAFGRVDDVERDEGEHEEQALIIPDSLRTDQLSLDNRFKVADNDTSDDGSDDDGDDDTHTARKSGESMEVDKDTHGEADDTPVVATKTFFFIPDDPRLKEGAKFHRQEDEEKVREKWLEKRFQLIEAYKSKHKNYKRKHKDTGGKQIQKGGKYQRRK